MGKKFWIAGIIILLILITAIVYILYSQKSFQSLTYEECVQNVLEKARIYAPAIEELSGAERTDNNGNIWVKQEDGDWKTNAPSFENTAWGSSSIDEQEGGAKYTPKIFPECEK